jgi:hypothetical protein
VKRPVESFILFFLFVNIATCYSQKNFLPGYIVETNGDTINGQINYLNWDRTPEKITFQGSSDEKNTEYFPFNIKGFCVNGERYLSAVVAIDDSPFRENELIESDKPEWKTDTVYLRLLFSGSKSLFYFKDRNKKDHFIIGKDSTFETLLYRRYLQNIDGVMYSRINEKYKGQLILYMKDYPDLQKKISYTNYNMNDLTKLFKDYYNLTGENVLFQNNNEKYRLETGLLAGLSISKLRFYGTDFYLPLTGVDFPKSPSYAVGGFVNIILPRKRERISIVNEIIFNSFKCKGQYIDSNDPNIYTIKYSNFAYSYVKLTDMVRYKLPVGKMFFYTEIGLTNGFFYRQVNHMRVEAHVYSNTYVTDGMAIASRNWDRGYSIGIGCGINRCFFEFRYENTDGFDADPNSSSNITGSYFLLGYRF